jgi:hypothetical protein
VEIGSRADITSDDKQIVIPNGRIEIDSNTFVPLDYMKGGMKWVVDIAFDPTGRYVLTTSYSDAWGILSVLNFEDANIIKSFDGQDFAGDIIFSPDLKKAYAGFMGNPANGGGRILIVDMNTLDLDNMFHLDGAKSLAVSKDGKVYASASFERWFRVNGKLQGQLIRGIIELVPINGANNLTINKVFFVSIRSMEGGISIGQHKENIFYKPGADVYGIEFTNVPPYGSSANLQGRVLFKDPNECNDYAVAVYILVPPYGWWTKPLWARSLTPIVNCNWTCDIVTGGQDIYATEIIAFLVPKDYSPPLIGGQQCLPEELYQFPYVKTIRYEKISFSGLNWLIKRANDPVGPGPNYFSDSNENVWVDPNGYLHLGIRQSDGKWYCSEVIADAILGYGKYVFTVKGRLDLLDENIVLGLFTWEDCVPQYNYREIDIEFSRWGNPNDPNNGQYVIQPYNTEGNRYRFFVDCSKNDTTTHVFTWSPSQISFYSYYGDFTTTPDPNDLIESWCYNGNDIPPSGSENPRINFWLMNGYAPTNGQNAEIVIKSFQYLPEIN